MDRKPSTNHHHPVTDDRARRRTAERWQSLGLFDPALPDAEEILDVLEFFESVNIDPLEFLGTEPAEIVHEINLRTLTPGGRVDGTTLRAEAGLEEDTFLDLCRSAGYDPDGFFTRIDIEAFSAFGLASAFFSPEELGPFIRVLRSLMSHLAEAMTAMFRIDISVPLDRAGGSQLDHAKKNWESAQLLPHAVTAMRAFLDHELTAATLRSDQSRQAVTTGAATTVKLAIGFVDIVGYTPMADALHPDELGAFIVDFERMAAEAVSDHGGRVVKLIGDEVMFIVVSPDAAFNIAQALIAAFNGSAATPRAGVVYGEMVARGGDYYGRVVNLASRISAQATAGEILTDAETATTARAHSFDPAGRRSLKGFAEPVDLRSLSTLS